MTPRSAAALLNALSGGSRSICDMLGVQIPERMGGSCSTADCHNLGLTKSVAGLVAGAYCSERCFQLTKHRITKGKGGVVQHCKGCRQRIGTKPVGALGPVRKWCNECRPRGKRRRPVIHCTTCQVPFSPRRVDQQYCGPDCRPYSWDRPNRRNGQRDPRSSNRWQRLRLQVLAEETHCGLCGEEVDLTLKYPKPGSPSADHIVAVNGDFDHPLMFERSNLQLAHFGCQCLQGAWIRGNQKRVERGYEPIDPPPGYFDHRRVKNHPKRPRRN